MEKRGILKDMPNYKCKYCEDTGKTWLLYSQVSCLECDKGRRLFAQEEKEKQGKAAPATKKHFVMPGTNKQGAPSPQHEFLYDECWNPGYVQGSGLLRVPVYTKADPIAEEATSAGTPVSIDGSGRVRPVLNKNGHVTMDGIVIGAVGPQPGAVDLLTHESDSNIHYTKAASDKLKDYATEQARLKTSFVEKVAELYNERKNIGFAEDLLRHWSLEGADVHNITIGLDARCSLFEPVETEITLDLQVRDGLDAFCKHLEDERLIKCDRKARLESVSLDMRPTFCNDIGLVGGVELRIRILG